MIWQTPETKVLIQSDRGRGQHIMIWQTPETKYSYKVTMGGDSIS